MNHSVNPTMDVVTYQHVHSCLKDQTRNPSNVSIEWMEINGTLPKHKFSSFLTASVLLLPRAITSINKFV